ncbi:PEP-CTERM sorting domain-containing protein [Chamaesiphon sp.]|uniref:PEP-CTERM sorting domain-containing protein n=1 Tax=Chamaesiphon sp. TaxID=2814140 RepID=UPI0035941EFE
MNFIQSLGIVATSVSLAVFLTPSAQGAVLYDQNFENPTGFVNDGGDVNIFRSVNTLYGNQPPGFTFAQANTVETLLITGNSAFGTGYSDPSGKGGNYALGMLSNVQNDLLGLSFNVGSNQFLNARLDISSIDLSVFSGPFVTSGAIPTFEFTLYDNPSGTTGLGSGKILSVLRASGTASARNVFDWTEVLLPLNTSGNTNGNVTLRIDLLSGGYAALDNIRIAASDTPGDVGDITAVPEPSTILGIALAGGGLAYLKRRRSV